MGELHLEVGEQAPPHDPRGRVEPDRLGDDGVARVLAHAGENARALDFLEKAYERRETPLYHIGVGWDWDALRPDPRFQSLLRHMNLPLK